ncbi:MAG: hypothetical protein HY703_06060 [Gemmatimonadetes bacterium]|nr:hypothetical protein [Gemmatimonadota bacterium]
MGQLGTGDLQSTSVPAFVPSPWAAVVVSVGSQNACALTLSAVLYCWGSNDRGQLGVPGVQMSGSPLPVAGGLTFSAMSAGSDHHVCGVSAQGQVFCWGEGEDGRLGNGALESSAMPVPVSGALLFTSVSAGFRHACGVSEQGLTYCWGYGGSGQLGSGGYVTRTIPAPVQGR